YRAHACERLWIDHVDGSAGGECDQVFECSPEQSLIGGSLREAKVRRADRVRQTEKRLVLIDRVPLENIDGCKARAALFQRGHESAWSDQLGTAGVDQKRGRFHRIQLGRCRAASRRIEQAQVQREHIAAAKEIGSISNRFVPGRGRSTKACCAPWTNICIA